MTPLKMRQRHVVIECRQVIGGVLYDTTTASKLAQSWYDEDIDYQLSGPQHPYDVGKVLFVNRWNRYFLYCLNDAGDWDREQIKPLTREQAILWAEHNLSTDDVLDIFAPLKEAGEE
jgi:hypothetical protein